MDGEIGTGGASERAKDLALLFPHRREELGLDEKAFNGMKEAMEKNRRSKNWRRFGEMAMRLAVLASESAIIDDRGNLRITPKPRAIGKKEVPLPSVRCAA